MNSCSEWSNSWWMRWRALISLADIWIVAHPHHHKRIPNILLSGDISPPTPSPRRSHDSNPGAATPYSLFKTYSKSGAATANPFVLRAVNNLSDRQSLLPISMPRSGLPPHARPLPVAAKRRQSPPRAAFRNLTLGGPRTGPVPGTVVLTLNSLR